MLYLHGGGYVLGGVDSHRDLIARLSAATGARRSASTTGSRPSTRSPRRSRTRSPPTASCSRKASRRSGWRSRAIQRVAGSPPRPCVALRDRRLPLPAAAARSRPGSTSKASGESMNGERRRRPDGRQGPGRDDGARVPERRRAARDPLASPLHGDLSGLPPLLIQVGRREVLLDDSVRFAARRRRRRSTSHSRSGPG